MSDPRTEKLQVHETRFFPGPLALSRETVSVWLGETLALQRHCWSYACTPGPISTVSSCIVVYSSTYNWLHLLWKEHTQIQLQTHLCRRWLAAPLGFSVSESSCSTVYHFFRINGGCPVSPPRCWGFCFILWPIISHRSYTPSSLTCLINRRSASVSPGASYSHIPHVCQTIFLGVQVLSLASQVGDRGIATAAATFKAWLCVVPVCRGGVWGVEAKITALAGQAAAAFHSRIVVEFWPWWGNIVVIIATVLVLTWPWGYLTFGNRNLIWDRDATMVLNAGAWN